MKDGRRTNGRVILTTAAAQRQRLTLCKGRGNCANAGTDDDESAGNRDPEAGQQILAGPVQMNR